MMIEYYMPAWMLKRKAKKVARSGEMSHTQALDEIAIEQGFRDWAELKHKGLYVPGVEIKWDYSLNT